MTIGAAKDKQADEQDGEHEPMTTVNRQVLLTTRPPGIPQAEHFTISTAPVPEPGPGEFLVRNHYLGVEPAQRGWASAVANYSDPVPLGSPMRGFGAGEVVASRHPEFRVGERLVGMFGWQSHALSRGEEVTHRVKGDEHPLSAYLGVLGVSGMTAYFGLLDVGRPKAGETVLVSTAAGAVGSAVGQIARLKGCRTIGIAGGPVKAAICREDFRYDKGLDYKSPGFEKELAEACAAGVDVYYDNTSGRISDAVLAHLNVGARVVICGTASVASWDPWPQGPRVERRLLVKRASMAGFLVTDHTARYEEAIAQLSAWVKSGDLRYREEILDGIESAPDAIAGLYRGENLGRRVIRL